MDLGAAGKVAVITGTTANIGRALALDFAAQGERLVLVGCDEEAGARVVALTLERGAPAATFVAADMTDPASRDTVLEAADAPDSAFLRAMMNSRPRMRRSATAQAHSSARSQCRKKSRRRYSSSPLTGPASILSQVMQVDGGIFL